MPKPGKLKLQPTSPSAPIVWLYLLLGVLTAAVYFPALFCQFVNFDDPDFVTGNTIVQKGITGEGLRWIWHSEVARNWHPITMLSHMVDCQLYHLQPMGHHLTNVLLHIANVLLLFYFLQVTTKARWKSFVVAGLFALHPLHVESVVWIAERKDLLSTMFWFLTFCAYARYAQAKETGFRWMFYGGALVFFALGLMSKPMLVTGPFVMLLLDVWPLRRAFKAGLILEKLPVLAMSVVLCWITYSIQKQGGAVQEITNLSLASRLGNALVVYVYYLIHMAAPIGLNALYLRSGDWSGPLVVGAGFILVAVSIIVVRQQAVRPWIFVGWFWYLGILVPVIGLVQVGMQFMADRFTYVSLTGIFLILVWGLSELSERRHWSSQLLPCVSGVVLAGCAALTVHQIGFWKNNETFFGRMIAVSNANFLAHYNLGNFYTHEHRDEEAASQYDAAVMANPGYADAHNNYGGLLLGQKKYEEAIAQYREAIRCNTQYLYLFNLANALADSASLHHNVAQFAEAERTYQNAIQMDPRATGPYNNLGMTFQAEGRDVEAGDAFRQSVQIDPLFELGHFNLANVLSRSGKLDEALAEYQMAAQLNPNRLETYNGMGMCYAMQNKMSEAAAQFRTIVRLSPTDGSAYGNLANALAAENRMDEAIPEYLNALRFDPADYQSEFNLGLTYARAGKTSDAAAHYRAALRIKPDYAAAQQALQALGDTVK